MTKLLTIPLLLTFLLQASCANNPPQNSPARSKAEVMQKLQEIQAGKQQKLATARTAERKSIIPDINENSHRGDIARKMMARSTSQFLKADANHDYQISVEEARLHYPHVSKDFSRYDKNNNDSLSWQELIGHDEWPTPSHGNAGPQTIGKTSL